MMGCAVLVDLQGKLKQRGEETYPANRPDLVCTRSHRIGLVVLHTEMERMMLDGVVVPAMAMAERQPEIAKR